MRHFSQTFRYGTLLREIQIVFLAVPEFGLFDSKLKCVKILSRTDTGPKTLERHLICLIDLPVLRQNVTSHIPTKHDIPQFSMFDFFQAS
jgi:hypothetical protein